MQRTDTDPQPSFASEFQAQARQELSRLEANLRELDAELAALQRKRNRVAEAVGHLQGLQGVLPIEDDEEAPDPGFAAPASASKSRRVADADLVVDYLAEIGQPTHYRQLYQALAQRGLAVGGKDPANTLLSRYFNDPRLERVARGTYALKEATQ